MRARGFLETENDRTIFRAAQPVWHAFAQNTWCCLLGTGPRALPGYHQDNPRALDLRPRQEFPQGRESLLPAQARQVERGVGGGVAARELLAKPPLKRRERGRSPALDRRRRRLRAGSLGPMVTGLACRKFRVGTRLRKLRQTASRPARDAPRHVKPELDLFRAQPPEPGRSGGREVFIHGSGTSAAGRRTTTSPACPNIACPGAPRHPPSRRKYRRGRVPVMAEPVSWAIIRRRNGEEDEPRQGRSAAIQKRQSVSPDRAVDGDRPYRQRQLNPWPADRAAGQFALPRGARRKHRICCECISAAPASQDFLAVRARSIVSEKVARSDHIGFGDFASIDQNAPD